MIPVLLAALIAASPTCTRSGKRCSADRPRGARSSSGTSQSAFSLSKSYVYPYTGPRLTVCTTDPTCVSHGAVGAVTGSTTLWETIGGDGGTLSTTDRACTVINSPIPGVKAQVMSGSCSPSVTAKPIWDIFQGNTAHSILAFGYSPEQSGYAIWFASNLGYGYYGMYTNSGTVKINDYDANAATKANSAFTTPTTLMSTYDGRAPDGGTAGYVVYTPAGTGAGGVTAARLAWPADYKFWYGDRVDHDLGMTGPLYEIDSFNAVKTQADYDTQIQKFGGVYNAAGNTTGGLSGIVGLDNLDTTGEVSAPIGPYVTALGIQSAASFQNKWAADALDLSTDTLGGDAAVVTNTSSGPFATWRGGAECDDLVSALGTGTATGASYGTTIGAYNNSVYAKVGVAGILRTSFTLSVVVAGGTGAATAACGAHGTSTCIASGTTCAFTNISSTAQRLECRAVVTGASITSIKPQILVTSSGSIQICQRQFTFGIPMQPPAPTNATHSSTQYGLNPSTDGWIDFSKGGYVEVGHIPFYDPSGDWLNTGTDQGTYYLFDAYTGTQHNVTMVFGYTTPGRMLAVFDSTQIATDGVSLTQGHQYVTRSAWRPLAAAGKCNLYVYHDDCGANPIASCTATTLIGSDTTGSAPCPSTPTNATLGNRYDNTVPGSMTINAVRVGTLL